ncbi:ClpP/crotonase-like domain-containing protein [Phlyctochytrium arcticum]|nr:ClpP/crotonase-like domain-containing protein [Phlyctochytrium arcticum]
MNAFTTIIYQVSEGICTITLNRPKQLNALSDEMYNELPVALDRAAADPHVALTLITANGRYFCSGADVTSTPTVPPPPVSDQDATRAYYRRRFDALNGPVVGVAAALISHADIIYAAENATLHVPFSALAISPEGGSSFMLAKRMGYSKAMEALLFSQKFDARELEAMKFVNQIFPADGFQDKVNDTLRKIIKTVNPTSLITTKRLVRSSFKDQQVASIYNDVTELTERFVSGEPQKVFAALAVKYGASSKL